jgi:hypothetical protein
MSEVNFGADLDAAEKEFNLGRGSDKFKFKERRKQGPHPVSSASLQNTYTNPKRGQSSTNVKFLTKNYAFVWIIIKKGEDPSSEIHAICALQKLRNQK